MKIGEKAPDFTLFDSDKKLVSLSGLKGQNVVLLFFPFAFSDDCTKEMCEIRDSYSIYSKLDAEVIGISTDSVFANKAFKDHYKLPFILLSDYNKSTSLLYNSLIKQWGFNYKDVTMRSVFVINKAGNIAYCEFSPNADDYPNMIALKKAVESLNQ
jgi:peroxiredoxin